MWKIKLDKYSIALASIKIIQNLYSYIDNFAPESKQTEINLLIPFQNCRNQTKHERLEPSSAYDNKNKYKH